MERTYLYDCAVSPPHSQSQNLLHYPFSFIWVSSKTKLTTLSLSYVLLIVDLLVQSW